MIQDKIEELIKPSIESMGYELWGTEYLAQGRHSLLRVYIDNENGIGISDCEKVSHQISALLDVEDPISGNYSLEVSSPGIPRPMFSKWQYERYINSPVQIKLFKPVDSKRKFTGIIAAVNDNILVLDVDGVKQDFIFSNIAKANLTGE